MQVVLTDLADTIYAYQTEFLTSLYLQYWRPDQATDTTRLSVAAHTFEVHATSGLSVTLANSTRVLHITASQLAMKGGVMLHGGRIRSEWRECVLAPLRTLPDLRELWLTDMHMDSFMHTDSLPFGGSPDTKGRDIDSADILAGRGQAQAVAPVTTSLESVVVVFNCSARNCKHGLSIHPTLAALPKSRPPKESSHELEPAGPVRGRPSESPPRTPAPRHRVRRSRPPPPARDLAVRAAPAPPGPGRPICEAAPRARVWGVRVRPPRRAGRAADAAPRAGRGGAGAAARALCGSGR